MEVRPIAEDLGYTVRPELSTTRRVLLVVAGTLSLLMAGAAAVLPIIPITPFALLALACYARASRRVYDLLTAHPRISPIFRKMYDHPSKLLRWAGQTFYWLIGAPAPASP